ncbi:hypothetical protein O0Q50_18855 [Priestia aryabhattai]|uniref:Uncharacterized protein n=1 Tax=Priestia aryabhattai TaxID=412384 RepID=A0AAX6NBQ7_PRIAR|nr:hypothetical protein [Priestia aryabhattai]MDU9693239.1 hypothetical protein [Priestia aryabhattai]
MSHSKIIKVQKTPEELKRKTKEIKVLYEEFSGDLLNKLPYLDKNYFRAHTFLEEKIYNKLELRDGRLTTHQLVNIFKWYIGRMKVRTICGFNNQELLLECRDLRKSGMHLDIYFSIGREIGIQYDFGIKFDVSKGYIENQMFKRFKEMEKNAVNLLGYERSQWMLQEIFVEGDDQDHFLLRGQTLEKFLKDEYKDFIYRWKDLILEKREEVKEIYNQSIQEIATRLKRENYDWLL